MKRSEQAEVHRPGLRGSGARKMPCTMYGNSRNSDETVICKNMPKWSKCLLSEVWSKSKWPELHVWNKCLNCAWQVAHLQLAFGFLDILSNESTVESEKASKAAQRLECVVSTNVHDKCTRPRSCNSKPIPSTTLQVKPSWSLCGTIALPFWKSYWDLLRPSAYLEFRQQGSLTGVAWIVSNCTKHSLSQMLPFLLRYILVLQDF